MVIGNWLTKAKVLWGKIKSPWLAAWGAVWQSWPVVALRWVARLFTKQGFANLLQVVALGLAVWSFDKYFIPEQTMKRLDERKAALEETVEKLDETIKWKELGISTKNALIDARNLDIATLKEGKAKMDADMAAVAATANAAQAKAEGAEERLRVAQLELGQTRGNLEATRVAQAKAEQALATAQRNAVMFRQRERNRLLPFLPAYVASRCTIFGWSRPGKLANCAVQLLSSNETAYAFSKLELEQAIADIRVYAEVIDEKWQARMAETKRLQSNEVTECEKKDQGEQRAQCLRDAPGRQLNIEQVRLGYVPAEVFVSNELKPWAHTLLTKSACPPVDRGEPGLSKYWPAGCL